MQKLYYLSFMRPLQALGLLFFLGGLVKAVPVASNVTQALVGQLDWPTTCQKVATVAAQIWGGGLWAWLMQYFISGERHLRLGLQNHADEPWLINPMWAAQHIRLSNRPALIGLSIAAGVYLTVAVPYAISTKSTNVYWTVGAVGLVLLLFVRGAWLKRKWNRAELRLGNVPGVIGGPFTGVVILHEEFAPGTSFEVSLKCVRSDQEHEGAVYSEDHTEGRTEWSSVLYIDKPLPTIQSGTTAIPVSFAVPFNCIATTMKPLVGQRTVRWKLFVNVKGQPMCGGCVFEVPIFRTGHSRRDFELSEELIAPYHEDVNVPAVLQRVHWQRSILPSGDECWQFSLLDVGGLCIVMGLIAVSAVGLWAAVMWFRASPFTALGGFFAAVFLFIGLYTGAEMLLWRSSIEIGNTWLTIESGFWCFRRRVTVPRDHSTHLACHLEFRKGNGEWWRIDAHSLYLLDPITKEVIASDEDENEEEGQEEARETDEPPIPIPTCRSPNDSTDEWKPRKFKPGWPNNLELAARANNLLRVRSSASL
jgi:hypothetical protein